MTVVTVGDGCGAPMPGRIVRINVEPGDAVSAGQGVVVMEAMKMENELRTTAAGTVKAVHTTVGATVEKGTPLVELQEQQLVRIHSEDEPRGA